MKQFKISYDKPENLKPYANNNKHHSDDQILRLASSIQEYGFDQPIVVDKNNVIIKGHARREAALKLKLKNIPVIINEDLSEAQVIAARIADNKSSSNEYNMDAIKFDLGVLNRANYSLNLTAIEPIELDQLMKDNVIDDNFQRSVIGEFNNTGQNAPNPVVQGFTEIEMPNLENKDTPDMGQMTFILHKTQIERVNKALSILKKMEIGSDLNENSNGNALAYMAEQFLGENE